MDDRERLIRIEAGQEALAKEMRNFCELQLIHNKVFYGVRDSVRDMKSSARGAWFVTGVFGAIVVCVSGFVSWLVATFKA